ncbi:hypothetical protein Emed_006964 [Eimeria media]
MYTSSSNSSNSSRSMSSKKDCKSKSIRCAARTPVAAAAAAAAATAAVYVTDVDSGGAHLIGYFSKVSRFALAFFAAAAAVVFAAVVLSLSLPLDYRLIAAAAAVVAAITIFFERVAGLWKQRLYEQQHILTLPQHQRKGYAASAAAALCLLLRSLISSLEMSLCGLVPLLELVRATAIRPEDIQRTLEEIGVLSLLLLSSFLLLPLFTLASSLHNGSVGCVAAAFFFRYLQGHHVLLLHPDLIKARLQEAGSGGVPVHPDKLHFSPYHQGPPQANEAMPPPTAEEE